MNRAETLAPLALGHVLAVAVGGAVGAATRWGVGEAVGPQDGFPWTTFGINVLGAALLALLPSVDAVRRRPAVAVGLGPGFLGGFTTLSAVSEEVRSLVADERAWLAGGYVLASLAVSLVAVHLTVRLATRRERDDFAHEGGLE